MARWVSKRYIERLTYDNGYFLPIENYELRNLFYDKNTNHISFDFVRETIKPKITRYKTVNYNKYPIYEGTSVTSKKIYSYNKKVKSINHFLDHELFQLAEKYDFTKEHLEEIFKCVSSEPKWFQLTCKIQELNSQWRNLDNEIGPFNQELLKRTDYNTKKDNLILRLIFAPFTLCLSLIGYRSPNRIEKREILNKENAEYNDKLIKDYEIRKEKLALEINRHNLEIENEIFDITKELKKITQKAEVKNIDEFVPMKDLLEENCDVSYFKNKKGVYIIWNKTKDKYYVGQSKDLYKRIFTQHFSKLDKDVKNIIFAKDWYENNEFYLRTFEFETKDELDHAEKHYIDMYNSFAEGYNKTSGNK